MLLTSTRTPENTDTSSMCTGSAHVDMFKCVLACELGDLPALAAEAGRLDKCCAGIDVGVGIEAGITHGRLRDA